MNTNSRYAEIREYILALINEAQIGDILPPEKQLAEKFSVSRTTVQNVMLALRREGFLTRRKGCGTFVNSKERMVFSDSESSYKGQIFYVYPDYASMDFIIFRKLIEEQALELQLNVIEIRISHYSNYEMVKQLAEKTPHLMGIIMFPSAEMKKEDIQTLQSLGVPILIIGGESVHDNIHAINPDYNKTGYRAAELFIEGGHRRIACVLNEPVRDGDKQLLGGMKKALNAAGFPVRSLLVGTMETKYWDDSAQTAYLETVKMLRRQDRPTAIFYRSSAGALAGLRAIREAGLDCPRDISILSGSSLFEPLNQYLYPRLGNITCKRETAVRAALDVIAHPEKIHSNNIIIDVEINLQESFKQLKEKAYA